MLTTGKPLSESAQQDRPYRKSTRIMYFSLRPVPVQMAADHESLILTLPLSLLRQVYLTKRK